MTCDDHQCLFTCSKMVGRSHTCLRRSRQESQLLASAEIGAQGYSPRNEDARLIIKADTLTLILFICQRTNYTTQCGTACKGTGGKRQTTEYPQSLILSQLVLSILFGEYLTADSNPLSHKTELLQVSKQSTNHRGIHGNRTSPSSSSPPTIF